MGSWTDWVDALANAQPVRQYLLGLYRCAGVRHRNAIGRVLELLDTASLVRARREQLRRRLARLEPQAQQELLRALAPQHLDEVHPSRYETLEHALETIETTRL